MPWSKVFQPARYWAMSCDCRSETVIKSFQATQGRRVKAAATAAGAKAAAKAAAKRAAAVVDAELARLAAAASEKWHNVQHLAHRWACTRTRASSQFHMDQV